MVVLNRIYTRTGDDGTTNLGDMSRTGKNDPRLKAYADVDEANSAIGLVMAVSAGILTGVLIHRLRLLREALDPLFATYYAIPVLAFYPLLIILFKLKVPQALNVTLSVLITLAACIVIHKILHRYTWLKWFRI